HLGRAGHGQRPGGPARLRLPPVDAVGLLDGCASTPHHLAPVGGAGLAVGMQHEIAAEGSLAGVTVLEIGVFMAGPFATMQLADLGARVIKVENPAAPDPTRATGPFVDGHSSPFARLNRNKESVALDLSTGAGRSEFLRLVEEADALVENLRPGALRKLGLG